MNTSKEWLLSYIDNLEVSDREYTDAMTLSGSKVEGFVRLDKNLDKIVVAKILEIERHPDADKLIVCKCDIGTEVLQIVTGASNVSVGDKVPLVLDGGKVAVGHSGERPENGIKIKKGKLRGVESFGMMCSIDELGVNKALYPDASEHGIYILDKEAKVGEDALKVLGLRDTVFEYEITSNRVDCFGILGLAREAAATFKKEFKKPQVSFSTVDDNISSHLSVKIKDNRLCKRYIAKMIKNVRLKESPKWLQHRLIANGIRPINNIVDITNYVMLEYGQPMHAFDYELIEGKEIIIDRAKDGDEFITLDGIKRNVDNSILMINDTKKSLAIAGIMGGENSKITDKVSTVVFESACFDGTNIRLSSKKVGLRTDSSSKFEKGLDPNNAIEAINRACQLVELLNAGDILSGSIDIYPNVVEKKRIKLEVEKINKLLGTNISKENMLDIFKALEIFYDESSNELIIPTFRQDLEYMADIAEEVARFYGYDNIETTLPGGENTIGGVSKEKEIANKASEIARFYGFSESMSYSFESKKVFDKLLIDANDKLRNAIEILNPLGEDFSIMRTISLNGILTSLSTNYNRRNKSVKLYELANIYLAKELPLKELPDERKQLTLAFFDSGDFFDMKGVLEEIFENIGIKNKLQYNKEVNLPFLHPGRKAGVYNKECMFAYIGQIHPIVAENYKLSENTYIAVIDMKAIESFEIPETKYTKIAKYPGMSRDISLVVPKSISAGMIEDIIEDKGKILLESYDLFDIYEGNQVKEGTKSLAYKINFRHNDRTLEEKEVSEIMEKIILELEKINVYLRA